MLIRQRTDTKKQSVVTHRSRRARSNPKHVLAIQGRPSTRSYSAYALTFQARSRIPNTLEFQARYRAYSKHRTEHAAAVVGIEGVLMLSAN